MDNEGIIYCPKLLNGTYYRGDGLSINIFLSLYAHNLFNAVWRGCVGIYGTACGNWSIDNRSIVLSPSKETEMMLGLLSRLDIFEYEERLVLIPCNQRKSFDQGGVSRNSCFQRVEHIFPNFVGRKFSQNQ